MEDAEMNAFLNHITETLAQIDAEGMMKRERLISSPQAGKITANGKSVINLCANNYLGLANHPDLIAATEKLLKRLVRLNVGVVLRNHSRKIRGNFQLIGVITQKI